jgi:uncharacterized protein DUF5110
MCSPAVAGAFTLYEDASEGFGYKNGQSTHTPLRYDEGDWRCCVDDRCARRPGLGGIVP